MNKSYGLVALVTVTLFTPGSFYQQQRQNNNPEGISRWTGTITMEVRYSGITGTSERKVTVHFADALPTLHRNIETTDLTFTDDKGTGSVTYHADLIIEGKKMGTTDCQGSGESELHEVVIDEHEQVYHFHAISPACSGTSVSLLDGKTESYGPEFTDIQISDQPLGSSKNLLAGTKTTVSNLGGDLGTVTSTITWHLERVASDGVLIVTPQNYDNWMPEPGRNELTKGSVLNLTLKVQGRNGQPPTVKAKKFELRLSNTTREPGMTITAPLTSVGDLPDLRFIPQLNANISDEFQFMELKCTDGISGTASIAAFDGGGWSTLTVVAILDDETRIPGSLLIPGGPYDIAIPKTNPGSHIAVSWLDRNGNPGDNDDKETSPGNMNEGDGLSAYEEYRGVIAEGRFKRLDPQKKEMGVQLKRAELSLFSQGLSWFENATGIKVIRFIEMEIGTDRRLNKNTGWAHSFDQFVQHLVKGTIPGDAVGENQPIALLSKIPAQSEKVVIDISKINRQYQLQVASLNAANRRYGTNIRMPYSAAEDIANTVAHELAHGININHHGMPSTVPNLTIPLQTVDVYHVYEDDGTTEIITRPFTVNGNIGRPGNDESGDISCIMAYTSLYQWAFRVGNDASLNYYAVKLLPVGTTLCTSSAGTGINAHNKYFGDAVSGNCTGQMKLRN